MKTPWMHQEKPVPSTMEHSPIGCLKSRLTKKSPCRHKTASERGEDPSNPLTIGWSNTPFRLHPFPFCFNRGVSKVLLRVADIVVRVSLSDEAVVILEQGQVEQRERHRRAVQQQAER